MIRDSRRSYNPSALNLADADTRMRIEYGWKRNGIDPDSYFVGIPTKAEIFTKSYENGEDIYLRYQTQIIFNE